MRVQVAESLENGKYVRLTLVEEKKEYGVADTFSEETNLHDLVRQFLNE